MIAPVEIPLPPSAANRAQALSALVPVLETARTRLRAPHLGDFDALHAIMSTDRGIHAGGPNTPEETWADLARATATWLLRGHGLWTVETRENNTAGFVLIGTEPGDHEHELGFLFSATHEGRGLASEAAIAARHYAFDALNLPSLVSYVAPGNTRAERLLQRLGARLDGMHPLHPVAIWRHHPEAQS